MINVTGGPSTVRNWDLNQWAAQKKNIPVEFCPKLLHTAYSCLIKNTFTFLGKQGFVFTHLHMLRCASDLI